MTRRQTLHATCVKAGRAGVLLVGPPGSGKSSLALELMDRPGHACGGPLVETRLVADDQVIVEREEDRLLASPPPSLAGILEVRGLGLIDVPHEPKTRLHLAVHLAPWSEIERLPEKRQVFELLDVKLACIDLDPNQPWACARLRAALAHFEIL